MQYTCIKGTCTRGMHWCTTEGGREGGRTECAACASCARRRRGDVRSCAGICKQSWCKPAQVRRRDGLREIWCRRAQIWGAEEAAKWLAARARSGMSATRRIMRASGRAAPSACACGRGGGAQIRRAPRRDKAAPVRGDAAAAAAAATHTLIEARFSPFGGARLGGINPLAVR